MKINVFDTKTEMGAAAARDGAARLRQALEQRGQANMIVATGASQLEMIAALIASPDIRWDRVNCFHLDEYVGLPISHPASFRRYLWERFHKLLPLPLASFHYLDGEADAAAECRRVGEIIQKHPIDVAFVGIGENGHLAFNDPPADFDVTDPYLVVELDEACRHQQLGEGWFPDLASVPAEAISMSIRQIMLSRSIICTVPDQRKARAVTDCLGGEVTNLHPASILQKHEDCGVYLDRPAAALLKE